MANWKKYLPAFLRGTTVTKFVGDGYDPLRSMIGDQNRVNESNFIEQYGKSVYVYRAVETIARKVANIDLDLYQIKNSKGDVVELQTHPLLDLLYKPNKFQTRSEFFKITMINKKLAGEAFWFKVRNESGQVVELVNLRPDLITIVRDAEKVIAAYELRKSDGTKERFSPEDIVHLKDPNPCDVLRGISPLMSARVRVDTESFATQYQRDFFLNNARPDILLTTDDGLTAEAADEILTSWEQKYKGVGKSNKPAILHSGLKYQQISLSQREMDYINSLKFTRDDILVAYGIPKSIITSDEVNYANAQAGMIMFYSETVLPEMQSLVETLNEMLVVPEFDESFYLDFKDPTPTDRATQLNEFTQGIDKWLTINEVRNELNLAPIDNGDELYRPLGIDTIGAVQQQKSVGKTKPSKIDVERQNQLKLRIFRGRTLLKIKLELQEKMMGDMDTTRAALEKKRKGRKGKKKNSKTKYIPLIKSELKSAYYELVNRVIDRRSKKFRDVLVKASNEQRQRVLANLRAALKKSLGNEWDEKAVDVKHKLNADDIMDIDAEQKVYADLSLPFLEEFLKEAGVDAIALVGSEAEFRMTKKIRQFLKDRADFFGEVVNDTTLKTLTNTLADGITAGEGLTQLSDRVSEVYDQFPTYRADRIARTEATAASNEGTVEGYKQSDVVEGKEWIATLDDRTRDSHAEANGEIVALDDTFSNGLRYPGDESGDPEETINCRCVAGPAVAQ